MPASDPFKPVPVRGRTYSLFGSGEDTSGYYTLVDTLAERLLSSASDPDRLLQELWRAGRSVRAYRRFALNHGVMNESARLSQYITDLAEHLKQVPLFTPPASVLRHQEPRYYANMIGIAVMNRLNRDRFRKANFRVALLPHCIREDIEACKAESDGTDYLCRHCRKGCYIGNVSHILKKQGITPYIWMTAGLKKLLRLLASQHGAIGVLGMACIPELAAGMRRVHDKGIPVTGIPLNANRCIRWMGEFLENSVDLGYLRKLTSSDITG
ncbi:MAG: DUF116 domain-containing protein [Bacteroidales bacterium]|nr:DUF116 domain-containing protein [Bacteroidales bacterium]